MWSQTVCVWYGCLQGTEGRVLKWWDDIRKSSNLVPSHRLHTVVQYRPYQSIQCCLQSFFDSYRLCSCRLLLRGELPDNPIHPSTAWKSSLTTQFSASIQMRTQWSTVNRHRISRSRRSGPNWPQCVGQTMSVWHGHLQWDDIRKSSLFPLIL